MGKIFGFRLNYEILKIFGSVIKADKQECEFAELIIYLPLKEKEILK